MIKILLTIIVTKIYSLILKLAGSRESEMLPVDKEEITGFITAITEPDHGEELSQN
jgi:hypothetical protein